ncbi:class I fructose-bisphosphate aldolase [Zymomonas mobilis]|uniref:class I fructose-bisphosphate aldolase n=1 Tax=Zymomonas mobilis TaxID=542 RepID=UPI0039E80DCF
MSITPEVKAILDLYESDNPGTKANLARILNHGRLGGTGKLIILPVDQGLEHGPARSFYPNPAGYDPQYHYKLAIDGGFSAFAAPLGMLETGAATFAGQIPTILKMNSSNSWSSVNDQAVTSCVGDALRLGCSAVGFTIYPGSDIIFEQIEEFRHIAAEAKRCGLATVIWAYPRGGRLTKRGETALDVSAYAVHIAAQIGGHIIKVKLPTSHIEQPEAIPAYSGKDWAPLANRVSHIMESAFAGRRMVVFSGGEAKTPDELFKEAGAIRDGGGFGSIMGRNVFQRSREEALELVDKIVEIYKKKD